MARVYTKEQNKRRNATPAAIARKKKWRDANVDQVRFAKRTARYGITPEQFDSLMARQSGRCKICLVQFESLSKACIDHNHDTGKVRALLCKHCNAALGMLRESEFNLVRTIAYLRWAGQHPELDHLGASFSDLPASMPPLSTYAQSF